MSQMDEQSPVSDTERDDDTQQELGDDDKVQVSHLTKETLVQGLSLLCKTGNGLSHAFVRLDLKDKGLNDISAISNYVHLRFLDLTSNRLADLSPLASLTQLLWLKVDSNVVKSFIGQPFAQLTFLQWLSLAGNLLTDVDGPAGPSLETLNVSGNNIQKVNGLESRCFTNLVSLELRGNHMDTTEGICLPNLRHLYLAQNFIKSLMGLEKLEHLTTLHLRDNQLETLNGLSPNMKCLQYLNVRGNAIADENALQSLTFVAKTLQTLVLSENPLVDISEYRLSVLIILPHLDRLDKDSVSPEEKFEARQKIKEIREEETPEP